MGVKAGWRSPKGTSTFRQTRGRARASVATSMACGAGGGVTGRRLLGAEVVSVVAFALLRVCKDGVGFGNLGESLGGFGVLRVHVWVCSSGKGVELSGREQVN